MTPLHLAALAAALMVWHLDAVDADLMARHQRQAQALAATHPVPVLIRRAQPGDLHDL